MKCFKTEQQNDPALNSRKSLHVASLLILSCNNGNPPVNPCL